MKTHIDILLTPAEFLALPQRDLSATVCVVFDILRATTSMLTALANGADRILPVAEIPEALAWKQRDPKVLLAGERLGLRIDAQLSGGVEFDLGNSPREFTPQKVQGKTIAMTTTNGTRALRACAKARQVLLGTWLNLEALTQALVRENPSRLLLVCSGTHDQPALEDVLAAGALCQGLQSGLPIEPDSDAVPLALNLYSTARTNLLEALLQTRNGRRLDAIPELRDDVPFCAQINTLNHLAYMDSTGVVRLLPGITT